MTDDELGATIGELFARRAGTVVEAGPSGTSKTELPRMKIWFNNLDDAHAFDAALHGRKG